jgi:hypothetical protein
MILTIAIPTIVTRKDKFNLLYEHINNQIKEYGFRKEVEIIYECDNKEMSIGAKRNKLYGRAKGDYCVQIDDDDWVPYYYVQKVMLALDSKPDCVGYMEHCTWEGKNDTLVDHSMKYEDWGENKNGFRFVRTSGLKTPVKTSLCLQAQVPELRFAEDHLFSRKIKLLTKTESYIPEVMYQYKYVTENTVGDRYGR